MLKNFLNPTTYYLGLFHIVPLAAFFLPISLIDWIVCISLYFIRIFFIGAGYHRYFAHKTYKTSRLVQFILAFCSQTAMQGGVVWWASHHRKHHINSDTIKDVHSPKQKGLFFAHIGWLMEGKCSKTDKAVVKDLTKYPELMFLDKLHMLPGIILATGLYLYGGLSMLIVGFFLSTLLVLHGTWTINSLMHTWGVQRYKTTDTSRNNLILAIITMGEGWHNNHHHYQNSTRQGFFWYEFDPTFYILKTLSYTKIIWKLNPVPQKVKDNF
ncbi:MAG: acyl-CoA desaturase [Nanoarchaeales archaeon]|nr:acyl-CoA desaturase [Nanoarchaeales archaeon]